MLLPCGRYSQNRKLDLRRRDDNGQAGRTNKTQCDTGAIGCKKIICSIQLPTIPIILQFIASSISLEER
jgi:hypothetical protein